MRRAIFVTVLVVIGCSSPRRSPLAEAARACHDGELSCAVPIFNVHDLRAAQGYYRDVLGFKVAWEDGDPPDFGAVTRGHATLFLCQGCQGTPGAWTMTFTPDVDALYREIAPKKALIRMPPRDMPWKLREMHVSDLDGNVLRFGSSIDH